MQDTSAELGATLQPRTSSATVNRGQRLLLFEVYAADYYPAENGNFDPAQAVARWAERAITWNGQTYDRRILDHDDLSRYVSSQFNDTSVELDNANLSISTFLLANKVAGMRLVARYVNLDITHSLANSLVVFVAELQRPEKLDGENCELTAKQLLGSVTYEVPQRTFSPQDQAGRSAADPLYEGFWFNAINGAFTYVTTTSRRILFWSKTKIARHSQQWSTELGTEQDQVLPLIFGRCQMEFIPALWADVGFFIAGLFVAAGHKVSSITNVKVPSEGYIQQAGQPNAASTHLGDLGGAGTNAAADTVFGLLSGNTALLSRTAYVGMAIAGPENPMGTTPNAGQDPLPTVIGVVIGEHDLPDGSGNFTLKGATSNVAYIARFFLTNADCLNLNPNLVHNGECIATAAECDTIVRDDTGAEMLTLPPNLVGSMQDGQFIRFTSAGVVDTRLAKYGLGLGPNPLTTPRTSAVAVIVDGDGTCPVGQHRDPVSGDCVPNGGDGCPAGYHRDPETGLCVLNDPFPSQIVPVTYFRRRYTFNAPLTDRVKAVDFFFNTILPAARMYVVVGSDGRLRLRTEKPADSSRLITSASAGANTIQVWDVDSWRTSLKGQILIGVGQTTSEVRKITAANYSSAFNSIPISASASGGMGLTASGSTLAGGGASTPSSGTFTVSGTPAAGAQIVATINGVPIGYTLNANDTQKSAAYMLAVAINTEWRTRGFMKAVWDGNVTVTVTCKSGVLTLDANLANNHLVQIASPSAAPSISAVGSGSLAPGTYYVARSFETGSGGETFISPVATVVISAGQKINVGSEVLPGGVSGLRWYVSKVANDPTLGYLITTAGASFQINTLPDPDAQAVPVDNTSGEEVIRVMMAFNEKNIIKGSFEWPLADRGSNTNQVFMKYREATKDFAERNLFVNDKEDQRRTKTINKLEMDGSGIDNFNQAVRLCNAKLAIVRDGDFFCGWKTDEAGIVLEEGDVVCVTDVTGGFVNLPLRLEELKIHRELDVSLVGRLYSTAMLADGAGKAPVVIPTTLKFFMTPPGVVTNLVLTEVGGYSPDLSYVTGIRGTFDFAGYVGLQHAQIYIKGPSPTEPADSAYRLVDSTVPDPNAKGVFEIRALERGKYWIKVESRSRQTGNSQPSGHPVASLELSVPLNTIVKIFDTIAPRDVPMGFGITVGVARASGAGAWLGAKLWRDRGYGYEIIAQALERESFVGVTSTGHAFLPSSGGTLYVVKQGGPDPTNATPTEITNGKNNYFVGREKLGVQTWTNLGGGVWQGTNLVRGLGGSDHLQGTHTAQEDVLLLDETVAFIPLEQRDMNVTLNFKAVTYGLSVPGVTAVPLLFLGRSVIPHPPNTFLGVFDPAGHLYQDWEAGELAEVTGAEHYELEYRNAAGAGATTIRGPLLISPLELARTSQFVPLEKAPFISGGGLMLADNRFIWVDPSGAGITFLSNEINNGWGFEIRSKAEIDPHGGFIVETEVVDQYFPRLFGIASWSGSSITSAFWWQSVGDMPTSWPQDMSLTPDGVNGFFAIPGERPSIVVQPDGSVAFYLNYLGASSRPLSVSPTKIDFTKKYRIVFQEMGRMPINGAARNFGFSNTRWLRQTAEFVYTGDMQRADNGGSLPATVWARVRQKSLYQYGTPSDWTYGTFTR